MNIILLGLYALEITGERMYECGKKPHQFGNEIFQFFESNKYKSILFISIIKNLMTLTF